MLDLTRLARALGFAFLGYFVGWPVLAVVGAIGGLPVTWFDAVASWWAWPVPGLFPVLSAVLTVHFFHRLQARRLRPTQVRDLRFTALVLAVGAGFAGPHSWVPLLVSVLCALPMFLPVKKRAASSTGRP